MSEPALFFLSGNYNLSIKSIRSGENIFEISLPALKTRQQRFVCPPQKMLFSKNHILNNDTIHHFKGGMSAHFSRHRLPDVKATDFRGTVE